MSPATAGSGWSGSGRSTQGLLADEDHGRLEGWADRVATLSIILARIEEKLALGTSRL